MKKLYENIENIHIKGDISQLSEMVQTMDISLQNITDYSDKLSNYLEKYSNTNKGKQFEKVVKTSLNLRDKLYDASFELNCMQNQIVEYQNKIYRYEDISASVAKVNPYLVTKRQINVDTSIMQFNKKDMMAVMATLKNYKERVFYHLKNINDKKNSIANIWQDSQYDDFAEFIDKIIKDVVDAIKIYEKYILSLDNKIKELN